MQSSTPSPEAPPEGSNPSPSESQSLPPDPTPTSPLFSAPSSPGLPPSPEPEPAWSPSPDGPAASVGPDAGTPSAPRSTGSTRARLRALRGTLATAVETVGGIAHVLLTRDGSPERDAQLYLPDQEDVDSISEPLASLASRRMPEGAENPDVTDLVQLGLAVIRYVFKQRDKAASIQRYYEPPESPAAPDWTDGTPAEWVPVDEPSYP